MGSFGSVCHTHSSSRKWRLERALLGSRVKLFMLRSLNRKEQGRKAERPRERDREKDEEVMGEEEENNINTQAIFTAAQIVGFGEKHPGS